MPVDPALVLFYIGAGLSTVGIVVGIFTGVDRLVKKLSAVMDALIDARITPVQLGTNANTSELKRLADGFVTLTTDVATLKGWTRGFAAGSASNHSADPVQAHPFLDPL